MNPNIQNYITSINESIDKIDTLNEKDNFVTEEDTIDYILYLKTIKSSLIDRIINLQNVQNQQVPGEVEPEVEEALKLARNHLENVATALKDSQDKKRPLLDDLPLNDQNKRKIQKVDKVRRQVMEGVINDRNTNFLDFQEEAPEEVPEEAPEEAAVPFRETLIANLQILTEPELQSLYDNLYKLNGELNRSSGMPRETKDIRNRVLQVTERKKQFYDMFSNLLVKKAAYAARIEPMNTRDKFLNLNAGRVVAGHIDID